MRYAFAAIPSAGSRGPGGPGRGARCREAPAVDDERRVHQAERQQQDQVGEVGERLERQEQREDADRPAGRQHRREGRMRASADAAEEPGQVAKVTHRQRHPRPRHDRGVGGRDHREERAPDHDRAPDRSQEGPRGHAHRRLGVLVQVGHDHDQHHQRIERRHRRHRDEDGPGSSSWGWRPRPPRPAIAENPKKVMKTSAAVDAMSGTSRLKRSATAAASKLPSPPATNHARRIILAAVTTIWKVPLSLGALDVEQRERG